MQSLAFLEDAIGAIAAALGVEAVDRSLYTQTVTMRSLATSRVFARWAPVAIACDQPRTFTLDPANLEIEDNLGGGLGRFATYRLKIAPNPAPETIASIAGEEPVSALDSGCGGSPAWAW